MNSLLPTILGAALFANFFSVTSTRMTYKEPDLEVDTGFNFEEGFDLGGLDNLNLSLPARGDLDEYASLYDLSDRNQWDKNVTNTTAHSNTFDGLYSMTLNTTSHSATPCSSPATELMLTKVLSTLEGDAACPLAGVLRALVTVLADLREDVRTLKEERCSGGEGEQTTVEEDFDVTTVETDDTSSTTTTTMATTTTTAPITTPPPPTSCPAPFQPVAAGCYFVQAEPRQWRNWGDAQAYCRGQGGGLAAPADLTQLRSYLEFSFSNKVWVGARLSEEFGWHWQGRDEPFPSSAWRPGKPGPGASRHCVFLDHWHHYRAVNHFCGEKFSFVCQHWPQ